MADVQVKHIHSVVDGLDFLHLISCPRIGRSVEGERRGGGKEGRRERRREEGEKKGGGREEGEEGESGDEGGIRQQSPLPYLLLPRLHGLGNLSQ